MIAASQYFLINVIYQWGKPKINRQAKKKDEKLQFDWSKYKKAAFKNEENYFVLIFKSCPHTTNWNQISLIFQQTLMQKQKTQKSTCKSAPKNVKLIMINKWLQEWFFCCVLIIQENVQIKCQTRLLHFIVIEEPLFWRTSVIEKKNLYTNKKHCLWKEEENKTIYESFFSFFN